MTPAGHQVVLDFANAIDVRDVEGAVALCDPEVEFLSVLALDGHAYVGHEGIRRYFTEVTAAWEHYQVEVHRVVDAPDGRVAIVMTMHARGRGSGVTLSDPTGHVWTLRDGRLLRNRVFRRPAEALAAVGAT